ncbi:hypothetical protein F5Y17DRAFT_458436 [Xylariaceae sp. FL0594]|nr:hypothetical protein F5Y17DRAFT_458436 [Xylariaceae sp. FL0594]
MAKGTTTTTTTFTHSPNPLILAWFAVSLPLIAWDSAYVFLRAAHDGGRQTCTALSRSGRRTVQAARRDFDHVYVRLEGKALPGPTTVFTGDPEPHETAVESLM